MTPCECPMAGYCARHKLKKNEHLHKLCSTDQRYYDHWEKINSLAHRPEPMQGCFYNHWAPLHYYAIKHWDDWSIKAARKWYRDWQKAIPKTGCGCSSQWNKETAVLRPKFKSAKAFFEWSWEIHEAVNERLDNPRVTLAECYEIWMPRVSLEGGLPSRPSQQTCDTAGRDLEIR